jgi:hypothetical protein
MLYRTATSLLAALLVLSSLALNSIAKTPVPLLQATASDTAYGHAKWLWLFAALPSSAGSALFQWREQWLPNTDKMPADTFPQIWQSWSSFIANPSLGTASRIPHSLNNLTTELVRADAEYWSKILLLIIAVQFIIILWRRRRQRS